MRASIIQLKQVFFQRIEVEAVEAAEGASVEETAGFDFDGIAFRVALDANPAPAEDENDPRSFVVVLAIAIDPAEGKPAPYRLDIAALGLVEISDEVEPEKRRDLALVNGASLVYGAVRELVTTLTARSIAGSLVLPTADFRDHSELLRAKAVPAVEDKPRRRRKRPEKPGSPEQS
jgi:preprotein translocase subunit SecB